ncbi:MoaF-related domain-containing protein [Sphingobacterium rhinopitheci]|uniref:MoaF-related domain-containing protein n=1 Tax=Sphingobacterium rhinopitheci TaxID=2781960 RepID=UPI001F526849|nr:hypothetical protein [Sphingobacterium rhinopitheci]MCI0921752.1 hypothetical protein [Sphingobacterium rhinopitheci]
MYSALKISFLFILLTTLSCQQQTDKEDTKEYNIIGKKATITYPEFEAEVNYISDQKLHWKTTHKDGIVNEGEEKIFFKKISKTEFLINWIEVDGLTVSKIVNVETGDVNAFISYRDENSTRGEREGFMIQGKWTENK